MLRRRSIYREKRDDDYGDTDDAPPRWSRLEAIREARNSWYMNPDEPDDLRDAYTERDRIKNEMDALQDEMSEIDQTEEALTDEALARFDPEDVNWKAVEKMRKELPKNLKRRAALKRKWKKLDDEYTHWLGVARELYHKYYADKTPKKKRPRPPNVPFGKKNKLPSMMQGGQSNKPKKTTAWIPWR